MSKNDLEKKLDNFPNIYNKRLYIWGTGNTASLYLEGLERLESSGQLHIEGYVDNNSQKWGGQLGGKKIISPKELAEQSNKCVLICTPQTTVIQAIRQQLNTAGIENYHIDEVILKANKEKVLKCYDLLEDDESKQTYAHIVICRIKGEYPQEKYISSNPYFQFKQFIKRGPQEIFIDCGAFVGDTLEQYIWQTDGVFKKIIAFEPDMQNCHAMEIRVNRLKNEWNLSSNKIEVHPYGVSDVNSNLILERYADNNGLGSKIVRSPSTGGTDCRLITIDDFIKEPFTFLKADIESYEYRMLTGAQKCLKKWHPLLAICIYHNAVDLYDIPLLIKNIVPEYKMKVRHYSNFLDETVLYAWAD